MKRLLHRPSASPRRSTASAVGDRCSLLYATGTIATGATHNDCADFRTQIAEEQGIDEEDVRRARCKARTQECLDEHELTRGGRASGRST